MAVYGHCCAQFCCFTVSPCDKELYYAAKIKNTVPLSILGAAGLGRDPGVSPLPASMEEESAEGSGGAGRRVGGDGMFSPPSSLKSGGIKVSLKKWSIWDKFYNLGTEMRMSKRGRFMFPYCEYSVSGLDPDRNYIMAMDISPVDTFRYRYNGCKWQINGKATAHVIGRLYFHPNGSVCGREWMAKPMSFAKLRLTNCPSAEEGHCSSRRLFCQNRGCYKQSRA
uniref:T-box domain-containing protein n=1 Tax=Callorhinchus milii TaxID=7868 RepID=A0A4W3H431_CALMI